jgi:hypothetical protein
MFAIYENMKNRSEALVLVKEAKVPDFLTSVSWRLVAESAEASRQVHLDLERHGFGLYHDGVPTSDTSRAAQPL